MINTNSNECFGYTLGDDAEVVIWNLTSSKKLQVIACPFNGAVGGAASAHTVSHATIMLLETPYLLLTQILD